MLIVFDLDGTLVNSRRDLADAANALLVERGGQPLPADDIASMVGEGAALLVRRVLAAAGLNPADEGALPRYLQLYSERLLAHTRLYDGTREVLATLSRQHTLAVLTNKPVRLSRDILSGLEVGQYFVNVFGGDGPHPRKPSPAGLVAMMRECAHAPRDTVMVGDSKIDMATARAAGTRLCVARYGFGFRAEEMPLQASDLVIDAPSDIPRVLEITQSPDL